MKKLIFLLLGIFVMLSGCGNADHQKVVNTQKEPLEQAAAKDQQFSDGNEPSAEGEQKGPEDSQSIQAQLQVIASHVDLWALSADYANDAYSYAVTDLDGNGRPEIIASNTGGITPTALFMRSMKNMMG